MTSQIHERARLGLTRGLLLIRPTIAIDAEGRTARLEDNLAGGIDPSWYEPDFLESTGPDFAAEMREVHASSTLAVNAFARWRPDPSTLQLAGRSGFTAIRFDRICPTPLDGPPAYLDFFAEAPDAVVGVEIKCLEHLVEPGPKYRELYRAAYEQAARDIADERGQSGWFDQIRVLLAAPGTHRALFAAQLIKQFIALTHLFPAVHKTLLYLYWEPVNWREIELFRLHRAELERFAAAVAARNGGVAFQHETFGDLWSSWTRQREPAWLASHMQWLQSRYEVAI